MPIPRLAWALGVSVLSGVGVAQIVPPPGGGMGAMAVLMRADANHDGVTTREEATAAADATFDRLDANHDGTVTPDEMAAARPMRGGPGAPPPPPPAPTPGANPPPMDAGAPPPPPPGGGMGRSFTRQQFRDRMLGQFDRIDTNHDGRIDATEMQAWRETMRQRRQERRFGGDTPPPPPPPAPPAGQ